MLEEPKSKLSQEKQQEFLLKHLPHRFTLLRTLRERKISGYNYQQQGDIYRCVKDSNLITARLFLDFFGLKGNQKSNLLEEVDNTRKKYSDEIRIHDFFILTNKLFEVGKINNHDQRILAGVYLRANKELAHLTWTYNDEFNQEDILIEAATMVEGLLKEYLFDPLNIAVPQ
jgi:hypothetical protein